MKSRLLKHTFEYVVFNFTKRINRVLEGNERDMNPVNEIDKMAIELYRKRKKIGKYVPKLDSNAQNACENDSVILSNKKGVPSTSNC